MRGPDDEDVTFDVEAARVRFEDLLLSLPYERALPDLPELLDRAGIPEPLLRRDERLLKVLHEAVLARPLGHLHEAERVRAEVELLTLEVEVLTDRLADRDAPEEVVAAAAARLREVTARLQEVRELL